eukprot:gene18386-biopygen20440
MDAWSAVRGWVDGSDGRLSFSTTSQGPGFAFLVGRQIVVSVTVTPKITGITSKSADLAMFAARFGHSEPGPCPNRMIRKALESLSSDASNERFSGFADAFSAPEWRFRDSGT